MTRTATSKMIRATGLTHREIADRLGVSIETVRSWAYGRRKPCCRYMEDHAKEVLSVAIAETVKGQGR